MVSFGVWMVNLVDGRKRRLDGKIVGGNGAFPFFFFFFFRILLSFLRIST